MMKIFLFVVAPIAISFFLSLFLDRWFPVVVGGLIGPIVILSGVLGMLVGVILPLYYRRKGRVLVEAFPKMIQYSGDSGEFCIHQGISRRSKAFPAEYH